MEQKTISRFPALQYRDFRLLWFGLLISNIGSQMQFAAINWHIFLLTNSAFALGLIGLARFVPIAVFSLIAGTVADAHNRKTILFITQSVMTVLSFILAFTTLNHTVTPFIIYTITALSSVALSFDTPPRQAIIPNIVDKKHLRSAMSLNVIMMQSSMVIGPAFAGFIIAQLGVGSIYVINAISFVAVIGALILMKTSGKIEGESTPISFSAILEGLKFVQSKTIIWSTMLLDFFCTFFASANALLPIFAGNILHVGPIGFGLLYAAQSIGAVGAGYGMVHMKTLKNQGKILVISVTLFGIATILFGISRIFILSFLALVLVGVGDGVSTIIRNTIRQLSTPDYIRGRMTSINMVFFMGGPQLGEFEAGLLAAGVGAPFSVIIGGICTILTVGVMAYKIPQLRKYKGEESLVK